MKPSIAYLLSIESKGIKLGLERTKKIMHSCGNPDFDLSVIQVAGTNGKGSVCAILEKIFRVSGYKTGLFTSPHLVKVNERIRINGRAINNLEIDLFIKTYKNDIERHNITFFECMTALSAWYFKNKKVDIAIMETGLGGKLDSVSIFNPIATVLTPISFDHMEILGNTLEKIATEKAGIMKKNTICISAKQKPEVEMILKNEAKIKCTPLYFVNDKNECKYDININGNKQRENVKLALCLLNYLKKYNINETCKINALKTLHWPGRNQIININPTVIFDVGHNEEGIYYFLKFYKSLQISGNSTLIIGLYARKKIGKIISLLEYYFEKIICTETNGKNPMPASTVAKFFNSTNNVQVINDSYDAISKGFDELNKEDNMVILGTHCFGPAISKKFNISFDTL